MLADDDSLVTRSPNRDAASDPAYGSVRQNEPISPEANRGRYLSRLRSRPLMTMRVEPMPLLLPMTEWLATGSG